VTTEAGQEKKAGWPVELWVAVDRDGVSEIYWGEDEPADDARRYLPETAVTGLVEALKWVRSFVDETAPEEDGLRRVVDDALSSYKQEVE